MSEPFYDVKCVRGMAEDFQPVFEVYAIGPQFCGGEKRTIALVHGEVLGDISAEGHHLPKPVHDFLQWCSEQAILPAKPRTFPALEPK